MIVLNFTRKLFVANYSMPFISFTGPIFIFEILLVSIYLGECGQARERIKSKSNCACVHVWRIEYVLSTLSNYFIPYAWNN